MPRSARRRASPREMPPHQIGAPARTRQAERPPSPPPTRSRRTSDARRPRAREIGVTRESAAVADGRRRPRYPPARTAHRPSGISHPPAGSSQAQSSGRSVSISFRPGIVRLHVAALSRLGRAERDERGLDSACSTAPAPGPEHSVHTPPMASAVIRMRRSIRLRAQACASSSRSGSGRSSWMSLKPSN